MSELVRGWSHPPRSQLLLSTTECLTVCFAFSIIWAQRVPSFNKTLTYFFWTKLPSPPCLRTSASNILFHVRTPLAVRLGWRGRHSPFWGKLLGIRVRTRATIGVGYAYLRPVCRRHPYRERPYALQWSAPSRHSAANYESWKASSYQPERTEKALVVGERKGDPPHKTIAFRIPHLKPGFEKNCARSPTNYEA